jgi:hypothetical protein
VPDYCSKAVDGRADGEQFDWQLTGVSSQVWTSDAYVRPPESLWPPVQYQKPSITVHSLSVTQ